uniref:Lysosomal Pro-X carboxypeptidase-like n=1 Tax=Nelumbo nucifera TaxID=4432 RepID=A0A822Y6I2_NELNU|nr:TPA_asm: hypothetical protein HUJ06_029101 [Nelumbo nucifera]
MAIHRASVHSIHWRCLLLLLLLTCVSTAAMKTPRLRVMRRMKDRKVGDMAGTPSPKADYNVYYYNQTLDHFNYRPESYTTFQQKYVINSNYWGGANSSAPIFVYLGDESAIDDDIRTTGFLSENAPKFNALIVFIEHRYYGKSVPFGSRDEAFRDASTLGYFSSSQALADYAEIILAIKKNLSAERSPVIVVGGSYGGMLAAWFRLKYPHIALGALASSAPILYFDDITPQDGYYSVVTKDFRDASESCYNTIRQSWSEIDRVSSEPNGLSILSKQFMTCNPITSASQLKDYLEYMYCEAAQYAFPSDDSVLKIFVAGVVSYNGNSSCYDLNASNNPSDSDEETDDGWDWQTCSEMVMPMGRGSNDTMFEAAPFDLEAFIQGCKSAYSVSPRPHWITTQFGGHDIKLILERFGSNIIFSNGLRDPYSSAGVLTSISDSLLAIYTNEGCHCLDIVQSSPDDPNWLVMQRRREIEIISDWIKQYYADLAANH